MEGVPAHRAACGILSTRVEAYAQPPLAIGNSRSSINVLGVYGLDRTRNRLPGPFPNLQGSSRL